jgi:5-formyltetrahydrofolate cyclo-ligase
MIAGRGRDRTPEGNKSISIPRMTPDANIRAAKAALRAQVRAELKTIWQAAKSVLLYAPLTDEPDLWKLLADALAAGKAVSLPRFDAEQKGYMACLIKDIGRDLHEGQFGIREPRDSCCKISLNRLDLILVPGLAFDRIGHRLGRGRGYYDRLLAESHVPTCGVAFDQQIVEQIPAEPHDVRLTCILTPTRWQSFTSPRAVLK